MSKNFSITLNAETNLRISCAMWMSMISSVGIYVIGIYLGASILKLNWLRPFCSALTVGTGISALILRKVTRGQENLQQSEKNILLQVHQEALYQSHSLKPPLNISAEEIDKDIYYQGW
ncbi:MAG: hypothetical protein DCF19_20610 [Pseudanabaena frigida]|uniref:Uncharacterized protein n=1 Tax=Pseudanabaena frigida TaxID=945775 RepID=A0A2W4VWL4_9CYAN|nr:MAG: hypothetical protein DCF19_20610 [Pseudanabaena frigida]